MKIVFKNFLALLLFTIIFSLYSQAQAKKILVGTVAQYPPFSFIEKGKIVGFEIDLMDTISKNLGYETEFKDMEFKDLFNALENGKVDIIVAGITVTPERMKKFHFSGKYYFPFYSVIHRKDSNIYSVNELDGKTVGVLNGSSMEAFLVNNLGKEKKIKTIKFTGNQFMLEALRTKEIEAIFAEDVDAKLAANRYGEVSYFLIIDERPDGYAIVFRKDSDLIEKINDELVAIKISRQLDTLHEKWGL